jgi:hypothetical protein
LDLSHHTLSRSAQAEKFRSPDEGPQPALLDPRCAGSESALSVGFNDRCDAIIATVMLGQIRPEFSNRL